jgi:hypothetical protein
MSRLVLGLSLAGALAAGVPGASAETKALAPPAKFLADREISAVFAGKTIEGHYADGMTFTETYGADGRISYAERSRTMVGRWLVRAGTFCTLYDSSPTGGCFRVARRGDNCFEFYFVARDEVQAEREPGLPSWTAQGWVKSEPATCREDYTV